MLNHHVSLCWCLFLVWFYIDNYFVTRVFSYIISFSIDLFRNLKTLHSYCRARSSNLPQILSAASFCSHSLSRKVDQKSRLFLSLTDGCSETEENVPTEHGIRSKKSKVKEFEVIIIKMIWTLSKTQHVFLFALGSFINR